MSELTPMMQQYYELRTKHPDCILFFRLGDFYEMFDTDALVASELLDITLTTRDRSKEGGSRMPMCGVPFHSAESYIARLIAKGLKVAICEQTEDPAQAKGLVRREVVRIITPGTVLESSMLTESVSSYLSAVELRDGVVGAAFCDITTGEFYAAEIETAEPLTAVQAELCRFMPKEVLLGASSIHDELIRFIKEKLGAAPSGAPVPDANPAAAVSEAFGASSGGAAALSDKPCAEAAVAMLLTYIRKLHLDDGPAPVLHVYDKALYMELDLTARRNMELCESLSDRQSGKKGTLLWVLDETVSAGGARVLRGWIERPLMRPEEILRRQQAVTAFYQDAVLRGEVRGALKALPDMERLVSRCAFGAGTPRDMRALAAAAGRVPMILQWLASSEDPLLRELHASCDPLTDIQSRLDAAIIEDPPSITRDGGFIREGFDPEADRLRTLLTSSKTVLSQMEAAEREHTGIKNLKIGYNKVFGYYLEVSPSYYSLVPESYIRKQTLASCERYYTPELKELEGEILSAGERLTALENQLYAGLRCWLTENSARICRTAAALAQTDVLAALAEAAVKYNYCRPSLDTSGVIRIEEGRHPVVERMLKDSLFVPNDTLLSPGESSAIITGPNMAGKSTYMRQVALLTLMAQIGSYIPAKRASIGVVDRIFTRVGASDNLAGGESTFMVEMKEVADILRSATDKSLIILDEVGRGTSTFDGMSVARAVLEYIHQKIKAKCLFATHYHELTDLEEQLPGVKNYSIVCKKRGEEIVFLRRIVPGGADDSFGVEVARLAGLPDAAVTRAKTILRDLENGRPVRFRSGQKAREKEPEPEGQLSLEMLSAVQLAGELRKLDVNTLSPIEALNALHKLKLSLENGKA